MPVKNTSYTVHVLRILLFRCKEVCIPLMYFAVPGAKTKPLELLMYCLYKSLLVVFIDGDIFS